MPEEFSLLYPDCNSSLVAARLPKAPVRAPPTLDSGHLARDGTRFGSGASRVL